MYYEPDIVNGMIKHIWMQFYDMIVLDYNMMQNVKLNMMIYDMQINAKLNMLIYDMQIYYDSL